MDLSYVVVIISLMVITTLKNWTKMDDIRSKMIYIGLICLCSGALVLYGMSIELSVMESLSIYRMISFLTRFLKG